MRKVNERKRRNTHECLFSRLERENASKLLALDPKTRSMLADRRIGAAHADTHFNGATSSKTHNFGQSEGAWRRKREESEVGKLFGPTLKWTDRAIGSIARRGERDR